jgi:hypothetical protein
MLCEARIDGCELKAPSARQVTRTRNLVALKADAGYAGSLPPTTIERSRRPPAWSHGQ